MLILFLSGVIACLDTGNKPVRYVEEEGEEEEEEKEGEEVEKKEEVE